MLSKFTILSLNDIYIKFLSFWVHAYSMQYFRQVGKHRESLGRAFEGLSRKAKDRGQT
jgi:hypothetical protein